MPNALTYREVSRLWRTLADAPDTVLLDGFHATKHALRFGADVPLIVSADKAGAISLAHSLASDLVGELSSKVVEIPHVLYRELVSKTHPTATAAWARRPGQSSYIALRDTTPRLSPIVVLDNPRNLGNVGAVIRLAAGMGSSGVLTTGDMDPWHAQVVRGSAGLHFAVPVMKVNIDMLPPGPLFALDPEGDDIRQGTIPDDALIAFGSERRGISAELRAR